ncbi:MAG TPA: phage portal protein [Rubrivivax sp.]|nr:phage portal protein [Rubrivivax sp.]
MSLVDRALSLVGLERRSSTNRAPGGDSYWNDFDALRGSSVTPRSAEGVSAVYACVSAVSETIASLPLILYQRTAADGRERARNHPLYGVLQDMPNGMQTALEFRELMQASVLLRGNAYAEIRRGHDGQVHELLPLHADRVQVFELDNGRLGYDVTDTAGRRRRLVQEEVFHLRHRSEDGRIGTSPIAAAREVVELAISEREHGTALFRNGTRTSGVLQFDGYLNDQQLARVRDSWSSKYAGAANAGKTPVLEGGLKYAPLSMTLEDAEWVAARQFSVEEVCRLFRVPPTVVGDLRHGNYSNSVEMARQFVTLTLARHLSMWEQTIARCLLTAAGRQVYFAEHSVEGLLRGDSLNRAEFYSKGLADGWLFADEVRRLENLPPREERAPHA